MKATTEYERDETKTWSGLPAPKDWHIGDVIHVYHNPEEHCGYLWERMVGQRITVMEDVSVKADGKRWLHVSVAKPNRKMPTYEDIETARKLFIGEERECYMVFPTKDRYINYENVLHLWACLDQPAGVLPHFEEVVNVEGREMLSI